ncbi:hypothetical protein [Streptomyces sp. NPDC058272]|uniref:hypothetical protein n=1 Tax=Streptomyces sp. NPDC058272 TaxID=3346415 RepID=UPI0036EE2221
MEPITIQENIEARQVRGGDVFVLHGHERTADSPAWPTARGHVHIRFAGGGDAVILATRPLTVTRTVRAA